MADAIQAVQEASAETQEILKELEAEGKGTVPGSEPAPKQEEQPKEPEPKVEEPAKKPEEPKVENTNVDPGTNTQDKTKRESKYVPVHIHNDERHKRQEAERAAQAAREEAEALRAQLNGNTDKPKTEELDTKAKRLAEKHGLEPDFIKDLLSEVAPTPSSLPADVLEDLKAVKELRTNQERQALEQKQETFFNDEFARTVAEFPDLADRKEEFKQLAFSEGKTNIPLRLLALEYRHDNGLDKPGRKTVEDPIQVSKKGTDALIDFANMTEDQLKDLDGPAFDQYLGWLDKNPSK